MGVRTGPNKSTLDVTVVSLPSLVAWKLEHGGHAGNEEDLPIAAAVGDIFNATVAQRRRHLRDVEAYQRFESSRSHRVIVQNGAHDTSRGKNLGLMNLADSMLIDERSPRKGEDAGLVSCSRD